MSTLTAANPNCPPVEALKDWQLAALTLGLASEKICEKIAGYEAADLVDPKKMAPALGSKKAQRLEAALELSRRALNRGVGIAPVISCPVEAAAQLADLRALDREHFVCLYLNARNQVIHRETVSIGSLSASIVHPREVFRPVFEGGRGVAALVLAHNHPSGDPSPSKDDLELTRRLTKAGQILGIEVLDHLIITQGEYLSLKEKELM